MCRGFYGSWMTFEHLLREMRRIRAGSARRVRRALEDSLCAVCYIFQGSVIFSPCPCRAIFPLHGLFTPSGRVAQLAEHSALNRQVEGSIPSASTIPRGPSLRSGFRLWARTPAKRLKFDSFRVHHFKSRTNPARWVLPCAQDFACGLGRPTKRLKFDSFRVHHLIERRTIRLGGPCCVEGYGSQPSLPKDQNPRYIVVTMRLKPLWSLSTRIGRRG